MITASLVPGALGVASVIAGTTLLADKPETGLRRGLLTGVTIGLWLGLWFGAASLAMANTDALSYIFGSSEAPQRATIAAAMLSWLGAALIARGLSAIILRGPRQQLVPGILASLAWAAVLIVPWLLPGSEAGLGSGDGVLALTLVLAALLVPVSRL